MSTHFLEPLHVEFYWFNLVTLIVGNRWRSVSSAFITRQNAPRLSKTTTSYLSRACREGLFRLCSARWLCSACLSSPSWLCHHVPPMVTEKVQRASNTCLQALAWSWHVVTSTAFCGPEQVPKLEPTGGEVYPPPLVGGTAKPPVGLGVQYREGSQAETNHVI